MTARMSRHTTHPSEVRPQTRLWRVNLWHSAFLALRVSLLTNEEVNVCSAQLEVMDEAVCAI